MTDFSDLLARANAGQHPRSPGQWTPTACTVWNEAQGNAKELIYAALVWELQAERLAKPDDESAIRQRMDTIRAATAAAQAEPSTL